MSEWIKCSDRLPEEGRLVVVAIYGTDMICLQDGETLEEAVKRTQKVGHVSMAFLEEDGWYDVCGFHEIVTPKYWMELPELPEKGEDDD